MTEQLLQLGTAGIVCIILLWVISRSEQRERAKDARIQLLENQLTESYDERITAADRMAEAIHSTRGALEALTNELRAARK